MIGLTIGEKIRHRRIGKGLTQAELGKKCGMADSQIGAYERNECVPGERNIRRIAEALEVSYETLAGIDKKEEQDENITHS